MSLKAGIVGLPNVGKSTLFNAITNSQVEAANYPFATIEPNVGIVELKDARLIKIAEMIQPEKILPATFEFIDIAGLVKGASKGEGLGSKFLSNIREVDAIIHVVRCFEDANITHVTGQVDPLNDVDTINIELLLADAEVVENVLHRVEKKVQVTRDQNLILEFAVAKKIRDGFNQNLLARSLDLSPEEKAIAKSWNLLTLKPVLYVGNVAEKFAAQPEQELLFSKLLAIAQKEKTHAIGISAQIESELAQLGEEEKTVFLQDYGLMDSGLARLTREAFDLLGLATYFTAGKKEVRAWTFRKGMSAPQCAGIIHTDFEKGFIRAEIIACDDYITLGGEQPAKQAGKFRQEGKYYLMQDGDIVHFRFNV